MNRVLTTVSAAAVLIFGSGIGLAANLYLDLDVPTLQVARDAVQTALEKRTRGQSQHWSMPGVARGSVTPRRTWRSASGHWCREFEEMVQLADGRRQTTVGIRCRTTDGRWRQERR